MRLFMAAAACVGSAALSIAGCASGTPPLDDGEYEVAEDQEETGSGFGTSGGAFGTSGGSTTHGGATGGTTSGGATSGGATSGGSTSGGSTSGGSTSGGAASGGAASGGPSGGATSGGAPSDCESQGDCQGCFDCALQTVCTGPVGDCENNPECIAIDQCMFNCDPSNDACFQNCYDSHPSGQQDLDTAYDCLICFACPSSCPQDAAAMGCQ